MKVQCPNCKKVCHETTNTFNPDIRPNGAMVELLDPWKSWGWGKFGDYRNGGAEVMACDMECPCCQAPLAPSGRLQTVGDDYQIVPAPKSLSEINQERISDIEAMDPFYLDEDRVERLDVFECSECGWTGKTEPALKRHLTMRHG